MRILIAGATGAIGRPSIRRLRANRHEVFALTRSPDALREIGAEAVIVDALDAAAVKAAVGRIRPDAVINELTSLPRHYTPAEMKAAAERDRKVRVEGNVNLLAALRDAGVRRYLLQSSGFWYAPGPGLADEFVPFISRASPGVEAGAGTYRELEARASAMPGIEFVALRYGFFYGPGTWYTREGDMGDQVRRQQVPIIGEGPRRLQLRAYRRCGRGNRCRTGMPAGNIQHRRRKPVASALVADGIRACCRSTWAASRQRRRGTSCVRSRRGLLRDEA
jgi:2-alkyl-3-oxoalkanoate reductase